MVRLRALFDQYRAEESDGAAPPPTGGAPSTSASFSASSPEVKALIDEAIKGLKSKNDELIAEKQKLKEFFGDVDKDTLKNYIERLKTDEESRMLAEGRIDEVIDKRTERMRGSYQSQLEEAKNASLEFQNNLETLQSKYHNTLIDNAVRDAAIKEGVVPTALDDIIYRARGQFTVHEDRLVSKDPDTGDIRVGADGKTPYGPTDFISDLKKNAPHFWPASTSGGYAPGQGPSSPSDLQKTLQTKGFAAYRAERNKQR